MRNLRTNKGITLITLIIYIILTLMVLGMLGVITTNFRKNLGDMDIQTVQDTEFDKLNLQLLKETKNAENSIDEEQSTETKIVFTKGNTYTYDATEQTVFLNDNIKVAEHVSNFSSQVKTINDRQKLTVIVEIVDKQRITDYITSEQVITTAKPGERVDKNTPYESDGKVATIPAGFTISGKDSESTIDGGLVIYLIPDGITVNWADGTSVATAQKTYDQFVWVPVTKINDMFMCQSENGTKSCKITVANGVAKCTTHNLTAIAGRLYSDSTGETFNDTLATQTYTSGGAREPDILTEYDTNSAYFTEMSSILGTAGYDTQASFRSTLQTDYNNFAKSVYENQGFWVGRYKTSNMVNTNTNTTVKSVAGTTTGINSVDWYRMYAQQKKYAVNKNLSTVKSSMIQGAAYDQVMKFVNNGTRPDAKGYSVTIQGNVGHGRPSIYQTGGLNYDGSKAYNDLVKNIYDLEGDVYTWTTESYTTHYRAFRGRML